MNSTVFSDMLRFKFSKVCHPFNHGVYRVGSNDNKCQIKCFSTIFCVFEDINLANQQISVGHFSINEAFRGKQIGEKCLRKFAAHVAKVNPEVNSINFYLYKLPTNFPHLKIAQARLALLNKVGAAGTTLTALPQGNYQVNGSWAKNKW